MSYDPEKKVKRVEVSPKRLMTFNPVSLQICIRSVLKEKGFNIDEPYTEGFDEEKRVHVFTQEEKK